MKPTAPHVKVILDAVLAGREITEEQVNTVLRDGKPMDLQTAGLMSSRMPYGPIFLRAARAAAFGEVPTCDHEPRETPYGLACAKCSMRIAA